MSSLQQALAAAASSGRTPAQPLVARLTSAFPDAEDRALPAPAGQPYSRHALHCGDSLEIMVARWSPGAACAPHDHGGCAGFVVVLSGSLVETDYTWRGRDLVAAASVARQRGSARGFGPDVIHAMRADAGGAVTLHVYSPQPERMFVYDLERREVLDLVGDFGAWIPDGDHPRTPFDAAVLAS
jgi:predicted metal-dependent enzyme (double-stranded beta helix superfamily)